MSVEAVHVALHRAEYDGQDGAQRGAGPQQRFRDPFILHKSC